MKEKRNALLVGRIDGYKSLRFKKELEKRGFEVKNFTGDSMIISSSDARSFLSGEIDSLSFFDSIIFLDNSAFNYYTWYLMKERGPIFFPTFQFDMTDKFFESMFFSRIGVDAPKSVVLTTDLSLQTINLLASEVGGFPCVIKKVTGSQGEFVGLIRDAGGIFNFIKNIPVSVSGKKNIILQEYIPEAKGSDYRVLCLDGEVIGGIKRTSQTDDFRANVSLGGKAEAFEVPKELEEICLKIMKEGKLFYAGLDFIWSEKRGWLAIEINTCAQFEGFEKATGINVAGKIVDKLLAKSCGK